MKFHHFVLLTLCTVLAVASLVFADIIDATTCLTVHVLSVLGIVLIALRCDRRATLALFFVLACGLAIAVRS